MDQLNMYNDYLLIDVRDDDEYRNGHIPGAINLPYHSIINAIQTIVKDKNQVIMVYCLNGFRSGQAYEKLQKIGYKHVIYLGSMKKYKGELENG